MAQFLIPRNRILRVPVTLLILFMLSEAVYGAKPEGSKTAKIADNFIKLYPDTIAYPTRITSYKWNYEQGMMVYALYRAWEETGDDRYLEYIKKNLDYYIQPDGSIKTYELDEYNICNIPSGKILLSLYDLTGEIKYRLAADILRLQLEKHPRTKSGGFWHNKTYHNQMWLDGLYMGEPFYAQYSLLFNKTGDFSDIALQFTLIEKHLKDKKTGLYYPGWDESKTQKRENTESGKSSNFWGRSIGLYAMALIDVLDFFPLNHPERKKLERAFKDLCTSLLRFRDPGKKLWYQVVNKMSSQGNYFEASASAMFIYSYAKGYNKGLLEKQFLLAAQESFSSLEKELVRIDKNGNMVLTNICSDAGLWGKPYRNSSFEYYITAPRRDNDFKGYGPFLLAALEIEKNTVFSRTNPQSKTLVLDYYYNFEVKNGKRFHYTFEDTAFSGFSDLGKLFKESGWKLRRSMSKPANQQLYDADVFILVDPDTPSETKEPSFLEEKENEALQSWVKSGGVLIVMANDSGNCEFKNTNKLLSRFGIEFKGNSLNKVDGKQYEMGRVDPLPDHQLFKNVRKIFMKEISSLRLSRKAVPILSKNGEVIIAIAEYGKGKVIAIGDPWLYNEYLDNRKLPEGYDNIIAAKNLIQWLESLIMKN